MHTLLAHLCYRSPAWAFYCFPRSARLAALELLRYETRLFCHSLPIWQRERFIP